MHAEFNFSTGPERLVTLSLIMSSKSISDSSSRNEHNKTSLKPAEQQAGLESESEEPEQLSFPDGGGRAWSVAAGCAGILFCTFGYINSFG
jgi:hypothetical protein